MSCTVFGAHSSNFGAKIVKKNGLSKRKMRKDDFLSKIVAILRCSSLGLISVFSRLSLGETGQGIREGNENKMERLSLPSAR